MRVFTNEQDLSYLAAFSNSAMAEVARLDMKLADSAKADFISSISHELRSPLHGILGMTDLLKDSDLDGQQVSHVATIETCGKTLLETINHVSSRGSFMQAMMLIFLGIGLRKDKQPHTWSFEAYQEAHAKREAHDKPWPGTHERHYDVDQRCRHECLD